MKKILAVILSAMLVSSCAAFSVSAYQSPNIGGDSDSDGSNGGDDGDGGRNKPGTDVDSDSSSSGSGSSSSTSSTSPKTGAPVSYGVLMAAAALAFGGVALTSKKKIEE